ncbi:hypothetical protein LUZ61_018085 [Rhynchospora tenuis]|uniref:Aminotransferase-like plant mobile domain-containing protein n=1 Tax=Rhynchospora tenuis TaxID=198213 RepID=A0AAD6ELN8_9POAL|nr:hypothetical protein LUZ61_018085 [Rhynchospora tenuis]
MNIDWALITALVERWRQETHTFHLPTGEIAPTLQDRDDWDTFHKPRGCYHLKVKFLRKAFVPEGQELNNKVDAKLEENSPPEVVKKYAISFMLDLFGSIMFPNKSDYLYAYFLPFIEDVDNPPKISWGSGLLAFLYRGLCRAAQEDTKSVAISALFLQIWTWTRFLIGRPKPTDVPVGLDVPFGSKWVGVHRYGDVVHDSVSAYRRDFEELRDDDVNWNPYNMNDLPDLCRNKNEMELWFYDGPLFWFYMVEAHPIQRVMRQMNKRQPIPPPLLTCPDDLHQFDNNPLTKVIRNVTVAHDAVAAMREFTGRTRAFARRVLIACQGNSPQA